MHSLRNRLYNIMLFFVSPTPTSYPLCRAIVDLVPFLYVCWSHIFSIGHSPLNGYVCAACNDRFRDHAGIVVDENALMGYGTEQTGPEPIMVVWFVRRKRWSSVT